MTSRVGKLQSFIRNITLHNSNCLCLDTIDVIVILHADITPKIRDNPNVSTQIVLNVPCNQKVFEVKAA